MKLTTLWLRKPTARISVVIALALIIGLAITANKTGQFQAFSPPPGGPSGKNSVSSQSGNIIRVKTDGNDALDGSTWTLAKKTIANAITTASAGDQIWVARGTYPENLTINKNTIIDGGFTGTEVTLTDRVFTKADPESENSTIDGQANGYSVVKFATGATNIGVTLDNINVVNGQLYTGSGAGIVANANGQTINLNRVVVANNKIQTHTAIGGGGVYAGNATLNITNSVFHDNDAFDGQGGGITSANSPSFTMVNTIFKNNKTTGIGGAMYLKGPGAGVIRNNSFYQNTASSGGGVYIYALQKSDFIISDYFYGNSTTNSSTGSAISLTNGGGPWINNSIFMGNTGGPVIFADPSVTMVSHSNTFANNTSPSTTLTLVVNTPGLVDNIFANNSVGGGIAMTSGAGPVSNVHNDFWNNSGPPGKTTSGGDVAAYTYDPKFLNTSLTSYQSSYALQSTSQLIDLGFTNTSAYPPYTPDANACDTRKVGAEIDLGGYEYQGQAYGKVDLENWRGLNNDGNEQPVPVKISVIQNGVTTLYPTVTTLGSGGEYTIPKLDSGLAANTPNVTVKVSADKFLTKQFIGTITACNYGQNISLPGGDVVQNNVIDLADINHELVAFSTTDSSADINGDGVANLIDLNDVLLNWAQKGD